MDTTNKLTQTACTPAPEADLKQLANERKSTVDAVIRLIIERMEEKDKGNLTTRYVISILREAITQLESNALMRPARDCLTESFYSTVMPEAIYQYEPIPQEALKKAMELIKR